MPPNHQAGLGEDNLDLHLGWTGMDVSWDTVLTRRGCLGGVLNACTVPAVKLGAYIRYWRLIFEY